MFTDVNRSYLCYSDSYLLTVHGGDRLGNAAHAHTSHQSHVAVVHKIITAYVLMIFFCRAIVVIIITGLH